MYTAENLKAEQSTACQNIKLVKSYSVIQQAKETSSEFEKKKRKFSQPDGEIFP